jgi:hypothetical protein
VEKLLLSDKSSRRAVVKLEGAVAEPPPQHSSHSVRVRSGSLLEQSHGIELRQTLILRKLNMNTESVSGHPWI